MKAFLKVVLLFILSIELVHSHATIFASDTHCSVTLAVGQTIMSKTVVSGNSRSIVVKRNGVALSSGDNYVAEEILSVSLSSDVSEYVLQVTSGSATFSGGSCANQRRAGDGELVMPASGSVTINGGSATSKGTVTMLDDFTLYCCSMGTNGGTAIPTAFATPIPSQTSTTTGVILCVLFLVAICIGIHYYIKNYEVILSHSHQLLKIPSFLALLTASLAMLLVSVWTQNADPTSLDQHYLGTPDWKTNSFSWHPVLMVGGFLWGQIKAINDWNLFPYSRGEAKSWHIIFHTGALICVYVGLWAVLSGYLAAKAPGYNTIHSWMGLSAIIVFTVNYALGFLMWFLTLFYPESVIRKAFDLVRIHRALGLTSLGLTNLAIISGIMDSLPTGVCIYPVTSVKYGDIFPSCQVAYSMGVMVVLSSLFTVLAVSLRNDTGSGLNHDKSGKWQEMPDL